MNFTDYLKTTMLEAYENMLKKCPVPTPKYIDSDIIRKAFLPAIGFEDDSCWFFDEKLTEGDGRVNVVIRQGENNLYYVESCSAEDISDSAIDKSVLTMRSLGIKYGVLTDGLIYTLISSKIESANGLPASGDEAVIFKFCLKDGKSKCYTKHKFLEYLHSKYILKPSLTSDCVMDNFSYIAQYKVFHNQKNKGDWHGYECTLLNFFEYLTVVKGKMVQLDNITTDDFVDFIHWQAINSKKQNAEATLLNKYSHISALITAFNNKGLARNRSFEKSRKDVIAEFNAATYEADRAFLSSGDVEEIIEFFKSSDRDNRARNIAIFGMCVYFGAERRTILNLKWNAVGKRSKTIDLYGHTFLLPRLMAQCFEKMKSDKKSKGIDSEYVFTRLYGKCYDRFSDSYINQLFDTIEKIGSESKWQKYKPQMIRTAVIYKLYQAGAYLDEIMCFAGISSKNLHNYISDAEISEKRRGKIFSERSEFVHPFKSAFNKSL